MRPGVGAKQGHGLFRFCDGASAGCALLVLSRVGGEQYEDADDCRAAIDNMNGAELFGASIRVTMAKANSVDKRKPVWEKDGDVWIAQVEQERAAKVRASESTRHRH